LADIEYARYRLDEWGKWARVNLEAGLTYPSRSVENRAIWGGCSRLEPEYQSEEKVDKIVLKMPKDLKDITVLYYVRRWRQADIARRMKMTRLAIEKKIEGAAWYVAAKLD
jgi:hypothetical protein